LQVHRGRRNRDRPEQPGGCDTGLEVVQLDAVREVPTGTLEEVNSDESEHTLLTSAV
jgi:hypothetical protein